MKDSVHDFLQVLTVLFFFLFLIEYFNSSFIFNCEIANRIYTKALRDQFKQIANDLSEPIKDGVYSSLGGPCYETVTELRGLAQLGADCAGMSTAHEALVASYCGMKVLAVALITNKAVLDYDSEDYPNHEEVIETANKRAVVVEKLIIEFVERVSQKEN